MPAGIDTDRRNYWNMNDFNNFTNADGSPYILVDISNTTAWSKEPEWLGSLYALRWYLVWEDEDRCRSYMGRVLFETRFNSPSRPKNLPIGPNPEDLSDIMNSTCAQFGSIWETDQGEKDACSKYKQLPGERSNPCAVSLDADRVKSISSRAAHLATMTPVTTSTQSETWSSANYAATVMPKPHAIFALGLLGGMPLLI